MQRIVRKNCDGFVFGLCRKEFAVVDTYMTRLGKGSSAAFLDDFWSELCKLSAIESDEQFRSGLYLGSQLILALSQPPARIPRP